ncbi:MAG TPA: glycosyltransferase [Desulforhopalus sp.]|nr:glycosyltransferase [Desulforhopalus sp.]
MDRQGAGPKSGASLSPGNLLAILSSAAGGDWPPLLRLAVAWRDRGHEVLLVADPGTALAARSAGFSPICLPSGRTLGEWLEPHLGDLLHSGEGIGPTSANPLAGWARACRPWLLEVLHGWRPSLIISSLFCQYLAEEVADALGLPWCCVNPGCSFGGRDRPFPEADFSPLGAALYQHWLLPPLNRADLVLHATSLGFDRPGHPLPGNQWHIGPLFWEWPVPIPEQLRQPGPPWLLLSLSTSPQKGDLALVEAAAVAAATLPVRVLATLPGRGTVPAVGRLPANMLVTGYLPHRQVLAHCRLVISNAGHGLVLKALGQGVPLLLIPWGRDQFGVASRAEHLGVARVIPREACRVRPLHAAISALLNDPGCTRAAQREARRLQRLDPCSEGCAHLAALCAFSG